MKKQKNRSITNISSYSSNQTNKQDQSKVSKIKLNAYLSGTGDKKSSKNTINYKGKSNNPLLISHEDGLSSLKDQNEQQKREPSKQSLHYLEHKSLYEKEPDHLVMDQSFHDEILGVTENSFSRKKPSHQLSSKDYQSYQPVKNNEPFVDPVEVQRDQYSDHYFRDLILDQLLKEFQQPKYISSKFELFDHENFNVKMVGHQFLGFRESTRIIISAIDKPNYLQVFGIHGDTVLATNNSLSPKSDKSILNRNIRQETIQAFLNERRIYEDPFLKQDLTPELKSQKSNDSYNSKIQIRDDNRNNSTISIEENPYEEAVRTNENSDSEHPIIHQQSIPHDFSSSLPDFSHEDIYYNHQNVTQLSESGEGLLRNKKLDLIKEETSQKEYGSMFEASNSQKGSQLELKKTLESGKVEEKKKLSTLDYTKSFSKQKEEKQSKSPMQIGDYHDGQIKTIDPNDVYQNKTVDEIKILSSNHSKQSSWQYKKLQFTLESEQMDQKLGRSSYNDEPKFYNDKSSMQQARVSKMSAQANELTRRTENLRIIDSKNISVLINENQASTQGTEVQPQIDDSQILSDFILINQNSAAESSAHQATPRNIISPKMPTVREPRQQSSKKKNQVSVSLNAICLGLNTDQIKQNISVDHDDTGQFRPINNEIQTLVKQAQYTERNENSQAKLMQDSGQYKISDKLETFQLEFEDITEITKKDIDRWGSKVLHSKTRVHDRNTRGKSNSKSRSPPVMESRNHKWAGDKSYNPSQYQQSVMQSSQHVSKMQRESDGSKASLKTLNKIIDFAKNTRFIAERPKSSKKGSRSRSKKDKEALKKILKNKSDEINQVVDQAHGDVFNQYPGARSSNQGKIPGLVDYKSVTSLNNKSIKSFSPTSRPQTQEKYKRTERRFNGPTGTTSQFSAINMTGNKAHKDSSLFPTTQKLKGIGNNNRYARTRSNMNQFNRTKASNMRQTKTTNNNAQRSTSQGRATKGSLNRLSVPNFRQIQEGLQVPEHGAVLPPGEDILLSPAKSATMNNYQMNSQFSKSQFGHPNSTQNDFRGSYNQNMQQMLINSSVRTKNKSKDKPREFLPDIGFQQKQQQQKKLLNQKKVNNMASSQFTLENASNPTGAQGTSGFFQDGNSTSTAMLNTNTEKEDIEGTMMANNQTFDLLNHHNVTNFESNVNPDGMVDNEIVTVNINRQKKNKDQIGQIENMMQSQKDASLNSIFGRGSPYKHMPDIMKNKSQHSQMQLTKRSGGNISYNPPQSKIIKKASVSALTSDVKAQTGSQLVQKKGNQKQFIKKQYKSPNPIRLPQKYQGKNTYRGHIGNTEISQDGLNSTYVNQSTRQIINFDYQMESARSAEKQTDFSQVVSMKKHEIQIRPINKAKKPLKSHRPPKGAADSKEYFNNRKKSNYNGESSRGSMGMRNQGSLLSQKSRNPTDKNTNPQSTYENKNHELPRKMSSSNFRILAEAIDEQDREVEQKYLMRKKTKEMDDHMQRIKNTVNKSVVKELEEEFNSQVVTQDIEKQRSSQNNCPSIADELFNSNNSYQQKSVLKNSGTFTQDQYHKVMEGNLLSFGAAQSETMRKVLQQSKSNFNGTSKDFGDRSKKISGNVGQNVMIKTKSFAHIPNKINHQDQLLMSPHHAQQDSITSMRHIGGNPGTNSNAINNPSNLASGKNLNIASLLSLQEADPIKAALDRKSSTKDQKQLAEMLNSGSDYKDGLYMSYNTNAQPNQ